MRKLRANVVAVTGETKHWRAGDTQPLPPPAAVEIEAGDGGFYLLRLDAAGVCIADTWHESAERAKAQAHFEYKVDDSQWQEVE
jgi:hypothetical protein